MKFGVVLILGFWWLVDCVVQGFVWFEGDGVVGFDFYWLVGLWVFFCVGFVMVLQEGVEIDQGYVVFVVQCVGDFI